MRAVIRGLVFLLSVTLIILVSLLLSIGKAVLRLARWGDRTCL